MTNVMNGNERNELMPCPATLGNLPGILSNDEALVRSSAPWRDANHRILTKGLNEVRPTIFDVLKLWDVHKSCDIFLFAAFNSHLKSSQGSWELWRRNDIMAKKTCSSYCRRLIWVFGFDGLAVLIGGFF